MERWAFLLLLLLFACAPADDGPAADASPSCEPSCDEDGARGASFLVKPYLVYPADKPMYPEYEAAVKAYLEELRDWYASQVGTPFAMAPLSVVRGPHDYVTMRCGESPAPECLEDPSRLDGNWAMYMNIAIHGEERWEPETVALVFGAGGDAGANLYPNQTGFAVVGDWVLEPLSGVPNEWGIPCRYSDGWQCADGVPQGTPAHELGHAFGLPHPGIEYEGETIIEWHGDYPDAGLLPSEAAQLRRSPFFGGSG